MANPYFNASYYLQTNQDVLAAGYNLDTAEQHYNQYGAFEAYAGGDNITPTTLRKPAPWFDIQYYLNSNPDLIPGGVTPDTALHHFTTYGISEGRSPNEYLVLNPDNLGAYAAANPDLTEAFDITDPDNLTPEQVTVLAQHFYQYGYGEDRPALPGNTYTLTEGADELTGTDNDDVFNAPDNTLGSDDVLDGTAGDDALNATMSAGDVVEPTLTGIDAINLTTEGDGGAINLSGSEGSGASLGITGEGHAEFASLTVADNASVAYTDYQGASVLAYVPNAFSGGDDTINVSLSDADVRLGIITSGGPGASNQIENLAITSNGSETNLFSSVWAGQSSTGTYGTTGVNSMTAPGYGGQDILQYTVDGTQSIEMTFTEGAFPNIMRIDATGLADDATATVRADIAGNDDFGPTGDDVSYSLAYLDGIDRFELFSSDDEEDGVVGRTINGVDLATEFIVGTHVENLTINTLDSGGNDDALTLTLDGTNGGVLLDQVEVNGVETLNLVSNGADDDFNVLWGLGEEGSTVSTVNITGDSSLLFSMAAIEGESITLNGADAQGELFLILDGDGEGEFTVTGSANDDVIALANGNATVAGGAGADLFWLVGADDEITSVDYTITDFSVIEGDKLALFEADTDFALVQAGTVGGASLEAAATSALDGSDGAFFEYANDTNLYFTTGEDLIVNVTGMVGGEGFDTVGELEADQYIELVGAIDLDNVDAITGAMAA